MSILALKVYEIFKAKLGNKEAETVMEFIDAKAEEKISHKKDVFLTKDDKVEIIQSIYKSVYTANIIQFIATIASLIGILKFLK